MTLPLNSWKRGYGPPPLVLTFTDDPPLWGPSPPPPPKKKRTFPKPETKLRVVTLLGVCVVPTDWCIKRLHITLWLWRGVWFYSVAIIPKITGQTFIFFSLFVYEYNTMLGDVEELAFSFESKTWTFFIIGAGTKWSNDEWRWSILVRRIWRLLRPQKTILFVLCLCRVPVKEVKPR